MARIRNLPKMQRVRPEAGDVVGTWRRSYRKKSTARSREMSALASRGKSSTVAASRRRRRLGFRRIVEGKTSLVATVGGGWCGRASANEGFHCGRFTAGRASVSGEPSTGRCSWRPRLGWKGFGRQRGFLSEGDRFEKRRKEAGRAFLWNPLWRRGDASE